MRIEFETGVDAIEADASYELGLLAVEIRSGGVEVDELRAAPVDGAKDLGLTFALAVGAFGISALGIVFDAIRLWRESHPRYSVTLERDGITVTMDSLSRSEFEKICGIGESSRRQAVVKVKHATRSESG